MTKKHIQSIYPRDKNALTTLAKCGYASHEQLREFLQPAKELSSIKMQKGVNI